MTTGIAALDEVPADDLLVCPACRAGTISADFQATVEIHSSGTSRITEYPDSDSFQHASCNNIECHVALKQEPGDGRLRHAGIYPDDNDYPSGEPAWVEIRTRYILAVEELLRRDRLGGHR